ncbi:Dimethylallyl tryptophan synthase [Tolypocladium paradoxum]|uniref:Dimethylallyl tryptophan synthase n=1 Tax=Tolypocladium paradoxum TaxID=94208 RepID=A0A2S4KNC2_9HYPO|nr:Dimethylallyl tryptophan synthase [Tolypocladium paradoxum]
MTTSKAATAPARNSKNDVDLDYWTHHIVPILSSLLKSAGSYSPADQDAHIRALSEYVLPNLGPRPSVAHTRSFLTQTGSPFQPSINLNSEKPQVRYCWELLGPHGGSDSDPLGVEAAREILSYLSTAFGFCTRWSDAWLSAFAPTVEEAKELQVKLPRWLSSVIPAGAEVPSLKRLPFVFVAFDLSGPKTSIKAYFNPKAKEIVTGEPATDVTWNVLRSLTPSLNAASIDVLEQFLAERAVPGTVELVGVDCVDEASLSDARVKIYVYTWNNSFNTVRDYVTLGGLLQDKTTLKGLAILRDIWHLLLQEPEGLDDDYNKPVNDNSIFYQKLYFSFEMRPGREFPEVKTYLPTWNYVRSDEATVQNYEEIFRKCGYELGDKGRYRKLFESAFGPVNHNRQIPVHCDASFLYSEKKGTYQTLYFSPPLGEEEYM